MKVAEERRFRDYRTDVTLDVRQLRVALRRLRQLTRSGAADRARPRRDDRRDLPQRRRDRAGVPRAAAQRRAPAAADGRRRHDGPVLRAGEPAAHRAARGARPARLPGLLLPQHDLRPPLHAGRACCAPTRSPTGDVLRRLDGRWKVVIVGDAAMHPAELLEPNGNIDPRRTAPTPSIQWLHRIADPLRPLGVDQPRAARRVGLHADHARHPPALPDVPPERRRPHARRCRRWSDRGRRALHPRPGLAIESGAEAQRPATGGWANAVPRPAKPARQTDRRRSARVEELPPERARGAGGPAPRACRMVRVRRRRGCGGAWPARPSAASPRGRRSPGGPRSARGRSAGRW